MSQTPSIDEIRARVSRKIESLDPGTPVASTVVFRLKRSEEARFEKSTDYLEKAATTLPGNIAFTFERGSEDSARDTVDYTSSGAWESAEAFRQYWESADLKPEDRDLPALADAWLRDNARFAILTVTESQTNHFRELGFNLHRIGPGEDNSIMVCLSREPLPRGGLFARLLSKITT